ncbi:hypothetical protein PF001_g5622 [Phytophthora fragariae]|uniref:PiggyBac transposable element-derived protein domain-containing protein n=1 Tax=Phytophthora fragariae TaxID=53985 RepID=A0A6A4E589_9STRA|nr:hypothetical protein PF009_g5355 [Phytophthora fragariae]KAE9320000.1 hypothetical protein PF001_g5622 [Phytophthora fragariae]
MIRDYHRWMGGVDVHDQLRLQRYSLQLAVTFRKYYKTVFLGIPIWLQQNNARLHVDENDPEVLVAGCSGGWTIKLKNQPAQSPELNCLDLGYFVSIQSAIAHKATHDGGTD